MKKLGLLLLTILLTNILVVAQPNGKKHEQIKALKIAYITEQLDLSPKQAESFWPVFNQFEEERHNLRKSFFEKYKNENPAADKKTARAYIQADIQFQEQELELKKKYNSKLQEVITPEQLVKLHRAERGFKEMLLKELRDRRGLHR